MAGDLKFLHTNCQNSFIFPKFCITFAISNSTKTPSTYESDVGRCLAEIETEIECTSASLCKYIRHNSIYHDNLKSHKAALLALFQFAAFVSCTANFQPGCNLMEDFQAPISERFPQICQGVFQPKQRITTRNDSELPGTWRKVLHYLLRWLETHAASPTTTIRSFFFPHIFLIFVSICCLIWLKDVMWFMWYRQNGVPFVSLLFLALVFPLNRPCSGVKAAAEHVKPCVWGPASCASIISGWWQLIFFQNFHPDFLGKWSQFDKYVEQNGWEKNQQLEI